MGFKFLTSESTVIKSQNYEYELLEEEQYTHFSIILVKYHGVDFPSFDGKKLLLVRLPFNKYKLDPHLLGNNHPVIARFEPNNIGWELARLCVRSMK